MTYREIQCQRIFASSRGMLVTKSTLLERLQCSESTLKRAINKLRDDFAVPLEYDKRNHGWQCDKNYTLPGLFFSDNELYAFLVLEQLLENMDEGLVSEQLLVAKQKINRLLSTKLKTTGKIHDKLRFIKVFHRTFNSDIFKKLAKAVFDEVQIEMGFIAKNRVQSNRIVSPQRLVHYKDNWYLDAFCHTKNAFRTFAINGIEKISVLKKIAKILPPQSIDEIAQSSYGIFAGKAKKIAKLHFYPPISFWIAQEKWHPKQQIKWLKNDILALKIPYNKEVELLADILRYAANVKVISPKSLRKSLIQQAQTLLKNNS